MFDETSTSKPLLKHLIRYTQIYTVVLLTTYPLIRLFDVYLTRSKHINYSCAQAADHEKYICDVRKVQCTKDEDAAAQEVIRCVLWTLLYSIYIYICLEFSLGGSQKIEYLFPLPADDLAGNFTCVE